MEMMGYSTEQTAVLFLGCINKPTLALWGRFDDIIMIKKQMQATLAKFKTEDFCQYFQRWCKCWACCIKLQGNLFKEDSMK
jgi:hypothetical protein